MPQHTDLFFYLKQIWRPEFRGPFILFIVGFFMLIGLGTWQLYRLEWKTALIEKINTNMAKPLVSCEDVLLTCRNPDEDIEFRPLTVSGKADLENHFKVLSKMHDEELGYHLVIPVHLNGGSVILVNWGWLPLSVEPDPAWFLGEVSLSGFLMKSSEQNIFTPRNNYQTNELYTILPTEIAREKTWSTLLPFYVLRTSSNNDIKNYPIPAKKHFSLRNFHLQYAITWYVLAFIWGVIFTLFMRQRFSKTR